MCLKKLKLKKILYSKILKIPSIFDIISPSVYILLGYQDQSTIIPYEQGYWPNNNYQWQKNWYPKSDFWVPIYMRQKKGFCKRKLYNFCQICAQTSTQLTKTRISGNPFHHQAQWPNNNHLMHHQKDPKNNNKGESRATIPLQH